MYKLLTLMTLLLFLTSCVETTTKKATSQINDVTNFKYDGAWYWVITYDSISKKEDIVSYVNTYANPNETSYFFAYPDTLDVSNYKASDLNFPTFVNTITKSNIKPTYGMYKMAGDNNVQQDAVWLLEQIAK